MGKKSFRWRHPKKNDVMTGSSEEKKSTKYRNQVPVRIDVAKPLYNSMTSCEGWNDMHLPDEWLISHQR
jgi:hypothetical protein